MQCSGPTAPVTVLVTAIIISSQSFNFPGITDIQFVNIIFVLSAILLFLAGVFKLGKFISHIPNVVISGFMTGIGLVIFSNQIDKILHWQDNGNNISLYIFIILITVIISYLVPKLTKKYIPKWSGVLSGTLISIIMVTVFVEILDVPIS